MKPLSYTSEKWLFDKSDEAWAYYLCYKYAQDRNNVKGIMPSDVKDIIKQAYKRDL